jgi:hypothetical protein
VLLRQGAHALLCLLLLTGVLAAATPYSLPDLGPESSVAPPGRRAMWVWSSGEPVELVAWATSHGVTTMFVYVDAAVPDVERLRELKRRCDEAGVVLDALGGEPEWAVAHAGAFAWRDTVLRLGLFRGIHVDVEPYLLPEWTTGRDAIVGSYLALLDQLAPAGRLEVDVPFWYDTVPAPGGTLADAVLARADAVTVMSYRNAATGENSIAGVGADLLRRGTAAAKPVRLAAETRPTPDCGRCSLHDTNRRHLRTLLASVDASARQFPAFAGIAVHDYGAWRTLPE